MFAESLKKPIVALYIRVSTEEQTEGFSLDAQQEVLQEYCTRNNMEIYHTYVDAGFSGKSIEGRPAFREMLHAVPKGHFNVLLCLRLNRLSRNLSDVLHTIDVLEQHEVALHSATEHIQIDNRNMARFIVQMLGATAELERQQISSQVKLAVQLRNKLGKWNAGNQVLGYRWHSNSAQPKLSYVETVPAEADVVRFIYHLYFHEDLGLKAITNRLNKAGHVTKKGFPFSVSAIRSILTNPNYIGMISYSSPYPHSLKREGEKQVIAGEHEPIISKELWEKVQQKLARRSRWPVKKVEHDFILANGLLRCPLCQHGMVSTHVSRKRKNGKISRSYYYTCSRYQRSGTAVCLPNAIRAIEMEQWVLSQLQALFACKSTASQIQQTILVRYKKTIAPLDEHLKRLEKEAVALASRNTRCFELFEDGHLDEHALKERLAGNRAEQIKIEKQQSEIKHKLAGMPQEVPTLQSIETMLARFNILFKNSDLRQRKALLHSLIDRIVIPNDRDITGSTIYGKTAQLGLPTYSEGD